jgi:hypothetical protein
MLETILAALLKGSPWALVAIMGWVIYKKDQRITTLNSRIDTLHGEFGVQMDTLHEKRLTDSKGREDKYQETATGLKDSLGAVDTRLQVIDAKLPSSGGNQ